MTQFYSHLERTVEPAVEPVSLAEVKAHLRVDHADDDAYIGALVSAARQACERFTGRSLVTQTWRMFLDDWPGARGEPWWNGARLGAISEVQNPGDTVPLPKGPIQSVSQVRTFNDADTAFVTASTVYYVATGDRGRLVLRNGQSWPSAERTADAVEITYLAGYGDSWNDVPFQLRHGINIFVADLYEQRESASLEGSASRIPTGAKAAWSPYRLETL